MDVWDESPLPPPHGGSEDRADDAPGHPDRTTASGGSGEAGNGPPPAEPDDPWWRRRSTRVDLALLLLLCVVIGVGIFVARAVGNGPDDGAIDVPTPTLGTSAPTTTAPTRPVVSNPRSTTDTTADPSSSAVARATTVPTTDATEATPPTTVPATAPPTTTAATLPPTTAAPTTSPPTTTTAPTTTSPPTTTPTTTRATTPPTTEVSTGGFPSDPVTVEGDDGRRLTVTPRRDACRGGADCLVVGFTISGFAPLPDTFVCEFSSGRRFVFRFDGTSVETACATPDRPDSIVVEVGGLRSVPIGVDGR